MIKILHQNQHFVFVEKPGGMLSVPSRIGKEEKRPILGILLEQQLGQKIFPLHRLDFEVSGLMVFSLSAEAHKVASKLWEAHAIQKIYHGLTFGDRGDWIVGQTGVWTSKLERGKKRAYEAEWGKEAITHFKVLRREEKENGKFETLWELEPKTGRSHQLRFELFKRGQPIVGDLLYGSNSPRDSEFTSNQSIALSSVEIVFPSDLGNPIRQYLGDIPSKMSLIAPFFST